MSENRRAPYGLRHHFAAPTPHLCIKKKGAQGIRGFPHRPRLPLLRLKQHIAIYIVQGQRGEFFVPCCEPVEKLCSMPSITAHSVRAQAFFAHQETDKLLKVIWEWLRWFWRINQESMKLQKSSG